jgi:DNA-binding GntR family transcriptional regulator
MSEEDEIRILMAREIAEDVCEGVLGSERARCYSAFHRLLARGDESAVGELKLLSPVSRRAIREALRRLGVE